ncbi:glutathionylspermidine synthase family protein [Escherichia coli]|nr:glutathionylspermidine synthase family protein [Escherichia coli]EET0079374.1 glutathionylspermidine synthase family protein [Escherichia coli]EEV0507481.1 glutathionylspermidine synthase family protein [Escherichia coli]EEZ2556018.1 glutathionylspermidine synthase family protein [Escherichia coli]EEZ2767700.1 glutathionylspermidine synthase family protein [Escherichia coli]
MLRHNVPVRRDLDQIAANNGFDFHIIDNEIYWDESRAYRFTLRQIEEQIEKPTAELHQMCLEVVDRAVRRLQQQLRKPAEELGREITHQLFLLGCGAQMLKYASPPMAQAWCQVMLDTRGGVRLSEQIQNDLLLRATGGVCV